MTQTMPNPPEPASRGHEIRDASPRPVLIFTVWFVVALIVVHLAGWGVLMLIERHQDAQNDLTVPRHPLAAVLRVNPPDPRLEPEPSHDVLPKADFDRVKFEEEKRIGPNAWAWVDRTHQFARIPVEASIDLAVARGLPETLPATQPTSQTFMPPASAEHGPGGMP